MICPYDDKRCDKVTPAMEPTILVWKNEDLPCTKCGRRVEANSSHEKADNLSSQEIEAFFKDFLKIIDELAEIDDDPTDDAKKKERNER